jgi:predicted MFS family arabinose efflux permease
MATTSASPWIVGALSDYARFSLREASAMVSLEMGAMGLTSLLLASVLSRIPLRPVLGVSVVLALALQVLSAFVQATLPMAIIRAISGTAMGAIYAIANSQGARAAVPGRTYAVTQTMGLILGTMLNPLVGKAGQEAHQPGVFLALFAYILLSGVPLLLLLRHVKPAAEASPPASPHSRATRLPLLALGVLGVMAIASLATGGAFNFMERVATWVGIPSATLGLGLALVSLLGIIGSHAATMLGNRFAPVPMLAGLVGMGAASFWFMIISSPAEYWVSFTLWIIVYTFTFPYIFGLAAELDRSGRLAAAAGSLLIIMGAVGASLGAYIVDIHGRAAFGITVAIMCAASAGLAAIVYSAWTRRQQSTA